MVVCGQGSFGAFLLSVIKPTGLQIVKAKSIFLLAKAKHRVRGDKRILFSEDLSLMYY